MADFAVEMSQTTGFPTCRLTSCIKPTVEPDVDKPTLKYSVGPLNLLPARPARNGTFFWRIFRCNPRHRSFPSINNIAYLYAALIVLLFCVIYCHKLQYVW